MLKGFYIPLELKEFFNNCSDQMAGQLLKAAFDYVTNNVLPSDETLKLLFMSSLQKGIDYCANSYKEKCEKNKANQQKRWDNYRARIINEYEQAKKSSSDNHTNEYDPIRSTTNDTNNKYNNKDKDKDNIIINPINSLNNNKNILEIDKSISCQNSENFDGGEVAVEGKKEKIDYKKYLEFWNSVKGGCQGCRVINQKIKSHINQRLKTYSENEILTALSNIPKNDFNTGNNGRGWVANLEYALRSDEIIERYLNYAHPQQATTNNNTLNYMQKLLNS